MSRNRNAAELSLASKSDQRSLDLKKDQVVTRMAALPLTFEPNQGQADQSVRFVSRAKGYSALLTADGIVVGLKPSAKDKAPAAVKLEFVGANKDSRAEALEPQGHKTNYFIGNDRSKWVTGVPNYAKVRYKNVYAGVDVVFHGNQRDLRYDFVVSPGASADQIFFSYSGVSSLKVDESGDLLMETAAGDFRQLKPLIYQEIDGRRVQVDGRYRLASNRGIGVEIARYDARHDLVIDPTVVFSSFVGGNGNEDLRAVTADSTGVYMAGSTTSATTFGGWPVAGVNQIGAASRNLATNDVLVAKMNLPGTAFLYVTVVAGIGNVTGDRANGIAVDAAGNAYIVGETDSIDFPVLGGFQSSYAGTGRNGFIVKLNPSGSAIVYSSYIGGTADDVANGVAVDSTGAAYVVGNTQSANFPTPISGSLGGTQDAFVTKIAASGASRVWGRYYGSTTSDTGNGIAIDSQNRVYIVGQVTGIPPLGLNRLDNTGPGPSEGYVARLTAAGAVDTAGYIGGASADVANAVAVDSEGYVYVAGSIAGASAAGMSFSPAQTGLAPLPSSRSAAPQTVGLWYGGAPAGTEVSLAYVTKISPSMSRFTYMTVISSAAPAATDNIRGLGLAVDGSGNAYVVGDTVSALTQLNGAAYNSGSDGYIARLDPSGRVIYLGHIGSGPLPVNLADTANGVAVVNSTRDAYVVGTITGANSATTQINGGAVTGPDNLAGPVPPGLADEGFVQMIRFTDASLASDISAKVSAAMGTTVATGQPTWTFGAATIRLTVTLKPALTNGANAVVSAAAVTAGIADSNGAPYAVYMPAVLPVGPSNTFFVDINTTVGSPFLALGPGKQIFYADATVIGAEGNPGLNGVRIPVELTILPAVATNPVTASTTGLAFTGPIGNVPVQGTTVDLQPNGVVLTGVDYPYTVSWVEGSAPGWLNVLYTTVTTPAPDLTIGINTTAANALAAGTYTANLKLTPTQPVSPAQIVGEEPYVIPCTTIPITLTITNTTPFTIAPLAVDFGTWARGTALPANKTVNISNSAGITNFTASTTSAWFTVTPASGSAGATAVPLTIALVAAGVNALPDGVNSGTITVSAPGTGLPDQTITVSLTIGIQVLTVPAPSPFNLYLGGPSATQTLTVSSSGSPLPFTATVVAGGNWLSASTTGNTSTTGTPNPNNLTLTGNPASLTVPGIYTATVNLAATGGGNPTAQLTVTANLTAQGLSANPTSVSVTAFAGTAAQTSLLTVSSSVSPLPLTVAVTGGAWLSATVSGNSAAPGSPNPNNLSITVNPSAQPPATYSGTVTVTGGAFTPPVQVAIPVTLIVQAQTMTVLPATVSLSILVGSPPLTRTVTVSTNATSLPFTATVTQGGSWLTAAVLGNTSVSGSNLDNLRLTIDPSALPVANYTGIVALAATGGGNPTASVSVQLVINPLIGPKPAAKIGVFGSGLFWQDVNGNYKFDGDFGPGSVGQDRKFFLSTGSPAEVAVVGDWNGDGHAEVGVYANGVWILDVDGNRLFDPAIDKVVYFGGPGWTPVVGDWNGDGRAKIGAVKDGLWLVDYNGNYAWDGPAVDKQAFFGGAGWTPVVGDWNGSGSDKIGAVKDGLWVVDYNGNYTWDGSAVDRLAFFGGAGWTPVVGDWNGSGSDKIGAYLNGVFVVDLNGNFVWDSVLDVVAAFGPATGQAGIVGRW